MSKLLKIIKKRKYDIFSIIVGFSLYFFNNLVIKKYTTGIVHLFFIGYFNDILSTIIFFSCTNICLSIIYKEIYKLKHLILITIFLSFMWEYVAIFINPSSTPDYYDVIAYMYGTVFYYKINNLFYNRVTSQ